MRRLRAAAGVAGLAPLGAAAHSFGKLYTLPVPVWMYLYGAAAALALSFLIIAWFVSTPAEAHRNFRTRELPPAWNLLRAPALLKGLRLLSMALLGLSILSGFIGSANSYLNFNMTFFWIVILLGYSYWVALFGSSYDALNPWRVLVDAMERRMPGLFAGRQPYPEWLGCYPALGLYMVLVWLELFGNMHPRSISVMLIAYSTISFAGAWWWGGPAWFRYCDLFGVLFGVIGRIAPLQWTGQRFRLQHPFIGLTEACPHPSLLLFVLFMLSSTALDGVHDTVPWIRLYWHDVVSLLQPMVGADVARTYPLLKDLYLGFQSLALLASPLAYLSVYAALLWLVKRLTGSPLPLARLCLEFGGSLVPIAFVYNLTHYYTLVISQGPAIFRQILDPLGRGWNLLGSATWFYPPLLLNAGTVWHTQIALILFGHIVGVYLAHLVALRLFPDARKAVLSQLPLLVLMMVYTTAGLWILSLPIQAGVWMPK